MHQTEMKHKYGTREWLEDLFKQTGDDPWGHPWRMRELCRYTNVMGLLEELIAKNSTPRDQLKFLDVGCSTGHFTNRLLVLGGRVIGIDFCDTAIQRANKNFPQIEFRAGSLEEAILVGERFHFIICLEVLYYVEKAQRSRFLSTLCDLLNEDGCLVISSVIGRAPYFKPPELIMLISKHFEVKAVTFYGCAIWASIEQRVYRLWSMSNKIIKFIEMNIVEANRRILESHSSRTIKWVARKLYHIATRQRWLKIPIRWLLHLTMRGGEVILGWATPVRLTNWLAQKFHWQGSHTIVVARKT